MFVYVSTSSWHRVETFRWDRNQIKSIEVGNVFFFFFVCIGFAAVDRKQEVLAHIPGCSTDLLCVCVLREADIYP